MRFFERGGRKLGGIGDNQVTISGVIFNNHRRQQDIPLHDHTVVKYSVHNGLVPIFSPHPLQNY
jgi:hypothetical protein